MDAAYSLQVNKYVLWNWIRDVKRFTFFSCLKQVKKVFTLDFMV